MRSLTLHELKEFGFPTANTRLMMFQPEDYARAKGEDSSGPTLIDVKSRLCTEICENTEVVRAIDDYPGYFTIFRQWEIPDRIGLQRPNRYEAQQYLDRGAPRGVESWQELDDALPQAP